MNTERFDYFDYDRLISIDFGSTWTKFAYYDIRNERLVLDHGNSCSNQPTACLYSVIDGDYDHVELLRWGSDAEHDKFLLPDSVYVDRLRDKVLYLQKIQPDLSQPLHNKMARFYLKAILDHLKQIDNFIITFINSKDSNCDASKNRYVMTYPSDWSLEQAAYLRGLAVRAGIVGEQDHPQRLIMYGEAESILRYAQEPDCSPDIKLKQGQRYMICDLGGSKVKMNLYSIKEPQDAFNSMLGEHRIEWNCEVEPELDQGSQNVVENLENFALNQLFRDKGYTVKDLDGDLADRKKDFGKLMENTFDNVIKEFTGEDVERRPNHYILIPLRLKSFGSSSSLLKTSSSSSSSTSSIKSPPNSGSSRTDNKNLVIKPTDVLNVVFKPVTDKIIDYIKTILETPMDVDALILVGGFRHSPYLLWLINEVCTLTNTKLLIPFNHRGYEFKSFEIVCGAIYKSMDTSEAQDPVPKIVFDNKNEQLLSKHSTDILVSIDLGFEKTRCSYIEIKPGQYASNIAHEDINRIVRWPGQESMPDYDFPTLNTMLIPANEQRKRRIISLRDSNYKDFEHRLCEEAGGGKYYSFELDDRGIILLSHKKSPTYETTRTTSNLTYEEVERLQVMKRSHDGGYDTKTLVQSSDDSDESDDDDVQTALNYRLRNDSYNYSSGDHSHHYIRHYKYSVTRQRISAKDFTILYLDYLHDYICDYISKETECSNTTRYRYCVTRDNHAYPEVFTLSDQDLHLAANQCNMLHISNPFKLLLLHHAEASAIYCRTLIDRKILDNHKKQIHFLQVYMYKKRCVLLLSLIPATEDKDSISKQQHDWVGMYRKIKSKNVQIDIMEEICNNLWTHLQAYSDLVEKCYHHKRQRKFFDAQNRQIFKARLQDYISNTFLDINDSEKMHTIYICNSHHDCCSISITNMDLLEFAIEPALNHLVSIIHASTLNPDLFRSIQLSDIFLLGEFLSCRDRSSYQVFEELLLYKLRKINFRRLDSLILQRMTRNTQVSKVSIKEEDMKSTCTIAYAALKGAVAYGLDPRNRLFERSTARTYAVRIQVRDDRFNPYRDPVDVIYQNSNAKIVIESTEFIPIINKGHRISANESNEIHNYFYLSDNTDRLIEIGLFASVQDDIEDFTTTNTSFDHIQKYVLSGYQDHTYPIVFKAMISQKGSYKFWVTHGKDEELKNTNNERDEARNTAADSKKEKSSAVNIRESATLMTHYN